jgi:hypothetical protein
MRTLLVVIIVSLVAGCGGSKKAAYGPSPQYAAFTAGDVGVEKKPISWRDIVVTTRSARGEDPSPTTIDEAGGDAPQQVAMAGSGAVAQQQVGTTATTTTESLTPTINEKLVIEGYIDMHADNVIETVEAIRTRITAAGGYIVDETVHGSESAATNATLQLRVPPAQATSLAGWLGTLGVVTAKRMAATEVSKTLFDQELAIKNLELTMGRLQALAEKGGAIETVLAVEKELTRVRGELEQVRGEQRFLLDRVAYATMTVQIQRRGGEAVEDLLPEARIYPGPFVSTLTLIDPGIRQRTRGGAGASVRVSRALTFDFGMFPRGDGGDSRAVIATIGTALYSGYLGYGERRWFNPYVGARGGYSYLSGHSGLALAAELGIEWFKHQYVVIDSSLRAVAFIQEPGNQAALQGTLGVAVPF